MVGKDDAELADEFERNREALCHATRDAFYGLEQAPALRLELSAQRAWILLVELQRAWHHTQGHSREVIERIARELQARYCPPGTVLGALADAGWRDERVLPVISLRWRVPEAFRRSFDSQGEGDAGPQDGGADGRGGSPGS
jgi:hypothetical protein